LLFRIVWMSNRSEIGFIMTMCIHVHLHTNAVSVRAPALSLRASAKEGGGGVVGDLSRRSALAVSVRVLSTTLPFHFFCSHSPLSLSACPACTFMKSCCVRHAWCVVCVCVCACVCLSLYFSLLLSRALSLFLSLVVCVRERERERARGRERDRCA